MIYSVKSKRDLILSFTVVDINVFEPIALRSISCYILCCEPFITLQTKRKNLQIFIYFSHLGVKFFFFIWTLSVAFLSVTGIMHSMIVVANSIINGLYYLYGHVH